MWFTPENLAWLWLIAGLVLAALELLLPGVYLIFVGLAAVLTGLAHFALPALSWHWQVLVFSVLAVALSVMGRGYMRRMGPETVNNELTQMLGKRYAVSTSFSGGKGRIRVGDSSALAWSDPADDVKMVVGATIVVVRLEGNTPWVAPTPAEDTVPQMP